MKSAPGTGSGTPFVNVVAFSTVEPSVIGFTGRLNAYGPKFVPLYGVTVSSGEKWFPPADAGAGSRSTSPCCSLYACNWFDIVRHSDSRLLRRASLLALANCGVAIAA